MHTSYQQEAFSLAYVRAVAAAAGFRLQDGPQPDDDSVDLTIAARGATGTVASPKLDVQLKCKLWTPDDGREVAYDLKLKNYEDLRLAHVQVPRILILVAVPEEVADWIEQDDVRLLMRHCGWWASLRDLPESPNTEKVRVKIPRVNRFDVRGLTDIMQRLAKGELP
ncbi:MAG: DUF4365 domain-containing protein [Planctomycetota bacterium]